MSGGKYGRKKFSFKKFLIKTIIYCIGIFVLFAAGFCIGQYTPNIPAIKAIKQRADIFGQRSEQQLDSLRDSTKRLDDSTRRADDSVRKARGAIERLEESLESDRDIIERAIKDYK